MINITIFIDRIYDNLKHKCAHKEKKTLSKRGCGLKPMRNRSKQHSPAIIIETMPNYNVRK